MMFLWKRKVLRATCELNIVFNSLTIPDTELADVATMHWRHTLICRIDDLLVQSL